MDEAGLNETGPLQVSRLRGDESSTVFEVRTDQSGLIGLLRHLHGRGAVLLSVRIPPQINESGSAFGNIFHR